MAKRDSDKNTQQYRRASEDIVAETYTAYTDSSSSIPVSDDASQFSKETTSDRKKKGWTKSLRKATSSILYMAMPPTSADNVPMVVAQTPMSPDRLIPALHSPILQSPSLMTVSPMSTLTPTSPSTVTSALYVPVSSTAASSTASVASSSVASTSSHKLRTSMEPMIGYPGSGNSAHSSTAHHKQRSSSTASSTSSSAPQKKSLKGKERAEPILADLPNESSQARAKSVDSPVAARFIPPASPPSSKPSQTHIKHTNSASLAAASIPGSLGSAGAYNEIQKTLPSPPLSPMYVTSESRNGNHAVDQKKSIATLKAIDQVLFATSGQSAQQAEEEQIIVIQRDIKPDHLPMLPPNISRLSFALDAGPERVDASTAPSHPDLLDSKVDHKTKDVKERHKAQTTKTREDIILESFEDADVENEQQEPEAEQQQIQESGAALSLPGAFPGAFSDVAVAEKLQPKQATAPAPLPSVSRPAKSIARKLQSDQRVASVPAPPAPLPIQSPPAADVTHVVETTVIRAPKVEIARQTAPSERNQQKPKGLIVDAPRSPVTPLRSLSISRRSLKDADGPKPIKNAPWLWHQDGIHHQRLESHQILTKEQVFELYHLDLEQDGPNGFFLFKLVKRFKKQDSSLMAISSALLDAELTASPASSPTTPTAILESLEAVSVSQKLKRQLLLQKRKKQRKSSNDNEEDENLEALLTMTNNNTSLQNLNSSLQEVIDAVDSLKDMKDGEEWSSLLSQSRQVTHIPSQPKKPSYPDSEGEYTSRDKDAMDIDLLEKRRGVYATGRLDGTNLLPKKKYKASQRRSSVSAASRMASIGSPTTPGSNGVDYGAQDGAGNERRGSDATDGPSTQQFKKQAVSQLHIYSRNGLKFKFDVMEDNELHFVEASKKYTFMDPLAAHRQPDLNGNSDGISPLRSPTLPLPSISRRTSSGTASTINDSSRPRRSGSTRSKSTLSSTGSASGRRVFVTRLGRHTLLTYNEYKTLTKSASSFTLGAKLLIQRSIAVATPSFYNSSSTSNGHGKESTQTNAHDAASAISPTKTSFNSSASPTPTPASGSDGSDYFSVKKKPRTMSGFASKAVAAIKSPSTPSGTTQSKTPRPIVTPYNPNDYKNKSLSVSSSITGASEESHTPPTPAGTPLYTPMVVDISRSDFPSPFPMPPSHASSPSEPIPSSPQTPMSAVSSTMLSTSSPVSTPSVSSSSSNPYGSIKRQGNQAGLKFQHLFVTVHQRLQKLELDNGASFYGSSLVQWTVIEDSAELRWWRDKIGIQMIGRLEGDELSPATAAKVATSKSSNQSAFSSAISVRSSYVSADSCISDATSSSSSSRGSKPYRSHVSVERLGYRFLRVSGHMGTLKVTVSEQVEARAVGLAVRAEMLRQKWMAQEQQGYSAASTEEDPLEQPWVELTDLPAALSDDDEVDADNMGVDSDVELVDPLDRTVSKKPSATFFDEYEYDEWTGRTRLKKESSTDRFSRRKRHDRAAKKQEQSASLIERMTMIVGQAKAFKGDWYMKNVYKFHS